MIHASDASEDVRARLTAASLFVCTAGSLGWAIWTFLDGALLTHWGPPTELAARVSPFFFLCGCVLVFVRPRLGYSLGVIAGLIAVPWFVQDEFSSAKWNSWVTLNYESPAPVLSGEGAYLLFTKLKILAVFLLVTAVTFSLLRLLPARWSFRRLPLRWHSWPAFAVSFLLLAVWFGSSVTPYHVPGYDHPAHAELRILHVEKRGLHFHETTMLELGDGEVWVLQHNRRLFQYRFEGQAGQAALAEAAPIALERSRAFARASALLNLQTAPPTSLLSWNAEGWYVVLRDSRILSFTSELGTLPPKEVTDWYHEIERLTLRHERRFAVRDVCLGFCYDAVAALGFGVLPQRMRLLSGSAPGFR